MQQSMPQDTRRLRELNSTPKSQNRSERRGFRLADMGSCSFGYLKDSHTSTHQNHLQGFQTPDSGPGEMLRVRALAALLEDPSGVPSSHP